jgi:hypothetical protein
MPNPTAAITRNALLCPSSQPEVEGARVLGVVQQTASGREVTYLDEPLLATPDVLAMVGPVQPTEVFRLAATCQTNRCPHFDGAKCALAARIVQLLPAVVDQMPQCQIRPECRWFRQEGVAACRRCPQIATVNYNPSETMQCVVKLPPPTIRFGEYREGDSVAASMSEPARYFTRALPAPADQGLGKPTLPEQLRATHQNETNNTTQKEGTSCLWP